MEWRLAKALEKLRSQVNAKYPGRKKDWDGSIGDAAHASRTSDHNPWIADPPGPHVVSAIDITHDPANGFDSYAFAEMLRINRDSRIKYIISNRRICAGHDGPSPWVWRKYNGQNPHDHHVHISVLSDKVDYDDADDWNLTGAPVKGSPSTQHTADNYVPPPRLLRQGFSGQDVRDLQKLLKITIDGRFGKDTKAAVVRFQKAAGIVADGIVGPQTWKLLLTK